MFVESIARGMSYTCETQADDRRSIDERVGAIAKAIHRLADLYDKKDIDRRTYTLKAFEAIIRNIDVDHSFDELYRKAYDGDEKADGEFSYIIEPLQLWAYENGVDPIHGTKPAFLKRIFKYLDFHNGNMDRDECEAYIDTHTSFDPKPPLLPKDRPDVIDDKTYREAWRP